MPTFSYGMKTLALIISMVKGISLNPEPGYTFWKITSLARHSQFNFRQSKHLCRYISIVKEEGLEISQPALDPDLSELHHHLTVRNNRTRVHRLFSASLFLKIVSFQLKLIFPFDSFLDKPLRLVLHC